MSRVRSGGAARIVTCADCTPAEIKDKLHPQFPLKFHDPATEQSHKIRVLGGTRNAIEV